MLGPFPLPVPGGLARSCDEPFLPLWVPAQESVSEAQCMRAQHGVFNQTIGEIAETRVLDPAEVRVGQCSRALRRSARIRQAVGIA
jgi:hypothetical protein